MPRADCQTRPDAKPAGQQQTAEGHQPPVLGLDPGRADALVPDLRGLLIGRLGFGRAAVAHGRSLKHQTFPFGEIDGRAAAAVIAGADGMGGGGCRHG